MNILDVSPLFSTIIGLFLGVFILFRKSGLGKNKKIRVVLSSLVFLYTYTSFDYYLEINGNNEYSGSSYLFYHVIGFLFYYFIVLFTRSEINIKKWVLIIIVYTLLRWTLFIPLLEYENLKELLQGNYVFDILPLIEIEYLLTSLLNIILLVFGFLKLKRTPLSITLNETQQIHYQWIKIIIVLNIVLQIGSFINAILNTNDIESFEFYLKLETLLFVIFFFILAYSMMHFPVFAFTGSFEDLPETVKKKYANSSLSDSAKLFRLIQDNVQEEKLYLDYDIKLNTLAEKLDQSIHHISQAINENAQMSFSDYINQFRIKEAKKMLLKPNPETIYVISLDVGFNSKAAFYNAFKKNTQQTPTEFKKLHKKSN
ncbi:helix-turn-helix domain-containing protein [uncultured Aquimarina sp.]|uniref:AraC family transcriptional regulator n=1 Tax=uncultured Aquimarina sp. TaxID=575652 RepID=UPI0026317CE3|nr:helix-turn-helix domain-containing protein [uncultured Aquimarina sp.]